MTWKETPNPWRWLILFTPAMLIVAAAAAASALSHGPQAGPQARSYDVLASGLISLPVAAVLCIGLAFWTTPKEASPVRRAVLTGANLVALLFVNALIAIPGCGLLER